MLSTGEALLENTPPGEEHRVVIEHESGVSTAVQKELPENLKTRGA